jgi:virginiamycin B lyase
MSCFRFISGFLGGSGRRRATSRPKPTRPRLALEALEDRTLPSTTNVFTLPIAPNEQTGRILSLDGNLYYTTPNLNEIGRITPTGQVTQDFAPGGSDLAVGADGNLYTALGNTIERITTDGAVTDFTIPTSNAGAESITAGPDGNIWFEETNVDQIGRLNLTTGAISEFALAQGSLYSPVSFGGITAGPDGNVWFTEHIFGQIGRISPDGTVTEFQLPANALDPAQITAGPDGNLFFTQPGLNSIAGQIGRITPTGQITEFTLPSSGGALTLPSGITTGLDGNIYFDSTTGLARITPTGQITEYLSTPSSGEATTGGGGITVGPDENIWIAGAAQIEQVILDGTTAAATTTVLSASPNPAVVGQTEVLTATVTSSAGTPSGTVTFFDGNTALDSAALNASGQATLDVSLSVGSHSLTASFGGNSSFAASTSSAVTETVNPASAAATTTTLSTSVPAPVAGQPETLTATVSSSAGTPSGTVTFFDGNTVLGSATLDANGQAALTVSLGAGSHSLTVSYAGNSAFAASSQSISEQVI